MQERKVDGQRHPWLRIRILREVKDISSVCDPLWVGLSHVAWSEIEGNVVAGEGRLNHGRYNTRIKRISWGGRLNHGRYNTLQLQGLDY